MHLRTVLTTVSCSIALAVPTAFAESVYVHSSSSVRVSGDESGTVINVIEQRDAKTVEDTSSNATINAASFHRITCHAADGDAQCAVETRGDDASEAMHLRMNEQDWWNTWHERLLENIRSVASEQDDDRAATVIRRTQATRLARRVCIRFASEERASCLDDALHGDGPTVRLRLREWIGQD